MSDYKVTDTELTSIANAIRTKGGTSGQLTFPSGFVTAIGNIPSGGGGSADCYYKVTEYDHTGSVVLAELYVHSGDDLSVFGGYAIEPNGASVGTTLEDVSENISIYLVSGTLITATDGKMALYHTSDYDVWFFMGFSINQTVNPYDIDALLRPYLSQTGDAMAKAYNNDQSATWLGNVGQWQGGFRLLNTGNGSYINNTIWATLECPVQTGTPTVSIGGGFVQDVNYISPSDYITQHSA